MTESRRSPFGELVRRHRRRLGMTQAELARRTRDLNAIDPDVDTIAERTVAGIEKPVADPTSWRIARTSTQRTLARVFRLEPGTPDHEEFIAAGDVSRVNLAATSRQAEFVAAGRESHLARLQALIDGCIAGDADVLLVGGDPGAGKTWIIEEACRQASSRHPGLAVLWSHCTDPSAAGSFVETHEPFRQQLRLMAGDLEIANPRQLITDANRQQLTSRVPVAARALVTVAPGLVSRVLSDLSLWQDEIAPVVEPEVIGRAERIITDPTIADRHGLSVCEQFFRLVSRYSEAGPVVLVMDDLHWADSATVQSLTHLVGRLHGQRLPVAVVGAFRLDSLAPGEHEPVPPFARLVERLPRQYPNAMLDLSSAVEGESGRRFVHAAMSNAGLGNRPDLAETLFRRTAGFPLYVSGYLRLYGPDDDRATALAAALDDASVPAEARSVYAEQLRRLPPPARDLLAAASVQGDTFFAEPLMHMLGLNRAAFAELVDSGLVEQFRLLATATPTSIAGQSVHRHRFSHALLRDHVDSLLAARQRTDLHASTAEAMVSIWGAEGHDGTDAIAYHFDLAADRARAAVAYVHAGNHAHGERAFGRAIRLFGRVAALEVLDSDPFTHVQSLVGLGNCYRGAGDRARARQSLDRALEIATSRNLPIARGNALESLAMLDFDAGEMRTGVDRLTDVIDLWTGTDHHEAGRAMANLSYLLYGLGQYEDAIAFAERGIEMAERVGDQRMWLDAQFGKAAAWMDIGLYEDAGAIYRRCLEVSRERGESHREYICWVNIALAYLEQGNIDAGVDALGVVLHGSPKPAARLVAVAEFDLGLIEETRGETEAARRHYETSRAIRERERLPKLLIDSLAGLLRVAVSEGDRDRTQALLGDIRARIDGRDLDGIEHVGRLFVTLIETSAFLGDDRASREFTHRAVAFLTDRADRLSNIEYRASYLTTVPAHRRLAELASLLGATR